MVPIIISIGLIIISINLVISAVVHSNSSSISVASVVMLEEFTNCGKSVSKLLKVTSLTLSITDFQYWSSIVPLLVINFSTAKILSRYHSILVYINKYIIMGVSEIFPFV